MTKSELIIALEKALKKEKRYKYRLRAANKLFMNTQGWYEQYIKDVKSGKRKWL